MIKIKCLLDPRRICPLFVELITPRDILTSSSNSANLRMTAGNVISGIEASIAIAHMEGIDRMY